MRQTLESYSVARRSWQPGHSTTMGEAPLEIDAVYGDKGKKGKHAEGKTGKDKGKGKHKGKHESSPKFVGYCGHCGTWGHKQNDCRYKNTVAEVDEEESVEPPDNSASGPHDFTHAALKNGPRPALKTATGELLQHYGTRTVYFLCQGEELRVGFTVVDVKRPILSVPRLMDRGIIQAGKQFLRRFDGATVELTRRGGLFVLQCQTVVPMLLAPVDEEPAEEAPDLPPVDEEMERELMGREEVEPPVAIEVPAPDEPTSDERRHHRLTHLPYQPWCNICVRARGRENRHVSRSQNQPGTPVIQCDCCFLKTEEDAPMVRVLVAIDTVYKQMVAIPLEKNGNRDPFASRSLAAFARYVGHPKSGHPRRLGARTHGSHPRRMRIVDSRNTTHFTCEQQGLKWSSRESSTIR